MPEQVHIPRRPDLSSPLILALLATTGIIAIVILLWPGVPAPGSPLGQVSASTGALLLLAPLVFSVMKRSGLSRSPPSWFVVHVLASWSGICLIFIHVAAGDWLTPAGVVLLFLIFLVLQGSLMRGLIVEAFSRLFARSSSAQGFVAPSDLDPAALETVIALKTALLRRLELNADEGVFSPALKHWLRHPWLSMRYQRLAEREARMIGARAGAGITLAWSRRWHLLVAAGFYLGLLAHIVVMLFFAGYAAGDGSIDWWHVTDWGRRS